MQTLDVARFEREQQMSRLEDGAPHRIDDAEAGGNRPAGVDAVG
jgi:hypothetical protein